MPSCHCLAQLARHLSQIVVGEKKECHCKQNEIKLDFVCNYILSSHKLQSDNSITYKSYNLLR